MIKITVSNYETDMTSLYTKSDHWLGSKVLANTHDLAHTIYESIYKLT